MKRRHIKKRNKNIKGIVVRRDSSPYNGIENISENRSTFLRPFHLRTSPVAGPDQNYVVVGDKGHESQNQDTIESPSSLKTSIWSASSFLHQLWFFVNLLAINNYQQSYNVWITSSSCSVTEAGLYSMLFSYSNLLTVFFGPVGGVFTDYMIRKAYRTPNELDRRVKEVQASFWPLLVTTVFTSIMYACLLFFHPAAIYVSLLCMVVSRPCIIAVSTAYLRIRFPAGHFNRLLGIYGTVASALLFLQYPHFMWAQHMYYAAHALILAVLAVSFLNPIHLLFTPLMRHAVATRDNLKPEDLHPVRNTYADDKGVNGL
ncbi:Solute carrier family 43 member 3 [Penaeus vannamei]|uniref:Solute carrier family 43 member 3 n=1 Tax=Penaeus vannamei TaxID=6689 RepID=A0A3R7Q601_PENVA|nr:Solute carrier family 43 member 3 [Penaeus vannamei]